MARQPGSIQEEALEQAIGHLAAGNLDACRRHLASVPMSMRRLDSPGRWITPSLLPKVFHPLFDPRGPRRTDPASPARRAVDIAGLLMLNVTKNEYDPRTRVYTTTWAQDPMAVIKAARQDRAISRLEPGTEPLVCAPVCALLGEHAYSTPDRTQGFSLANFHACLSAGYPLGDPHHLAAAMFSPGADENHNRARMAAVLPHLPSPLPPPIRDILWCHALRADHHYTNYNPSQSSKPHTEPGACQQLLVEHDIALQMDPATPEHSDLLAEICKHAADHLFEPLLQGLDRHAITPPSVLLRIITAISGQRYTLNEQKRIERLIDACDFKPHDLAPLSSALPGRKGNTALHCMIAEGSFHLARKLIQMGSPTDALNKAGKTPLMCSKKRSQKMVDEMKALAALAPMQPAERQFMLFKACRAKDVSLACRMMDEGANLFDTARRQDVIAELFMGVLGLSGADHQNAQSSIREIIDHHVKLHGDLTVQQACAVLFHATTSASEAIVRLAIEKGADYRALAPGLGQLYAKDVRLNIHRFVQIMTTLAHAGMDPDYRDKDGDLLFQKVWDYPEFSRAVSAVEQSREMEQSVIQAKPAGDPSVRAPRF